MRRGLPAVIALVLFVAALGVLRLQLHSVTWQSMVADVASTPPRRLALAMLLAAVNYAVLTGYDFLAFAYIGKRLPWRRIATASFVAFAISNNVGFAMLSGASVRYRFYTRWGVTAEELSRIVFSYLTTFWVGLLLVGGVSIAIGPLPAERNVASLTFLRPLGWMLVACSGAYVTAAILRLGPIRAARLELPLPSGRIALTQLAISALDWLLAGAVLFAVLPPGAVPFVALLAAFLTAQLIGLASHVPGGMGVFEGVIVLLLKPFLPSDAILPSLIVYRAVYYLLPLCVALVLLVGDELRLRGSQAARLSALFGSVTEQLAPHVLAIFAFIAGVVLLFSGATPAAEGRLRLLDRVFPLGVIEVSHFAGSVVGAALLVLSQGLARRLDSAWYFTSLALLFGIGTSVLKAVGYEEALALGAVLLVLWRARPAFDRRAALFDTRFSAGWIVAIVGAVGASVWLGLFAFKHVEYTNELWWQFELRGEASRMLRGSVGAAVTLLLIGSARLVASAPHEAVEPTHADLSDAATAMVAQTATYPCLVYLRDKAILFNDQRSAFVMYGVQGRTWVALGDPVGRSEHISSMIRLFLERCEDFAGVPVFYEISNAHLHRYADFGLTFVKLGEEARVDLRTFTLAGNHGRKLRYAVHRLEREQATFRVVCAHDVPSLMDQLRAVSNDWLRRRAGAEKGFSLGFFDPDYLSRFPVAVIEQHGQVVAFANVLPGPQQVQLSVDLMRYHHTAPPDVMDALFVHLLTWGRDHGYRWFSLGMAPLSGFEASPIAPLWNRLASFLYEHGGAIYNFQGLRAYKDKFSPVWESRYLAYPGGLRLPRILADTSALIAGGYRKILLK